MHRNGSKRHTYNTIDNNINTTDTILHKKNTSEEKIKQGLSTIEMEWSYLWSESLKLLDE